VLASHRRSLALWLARLAETMEDLGELAEVDAPTGAKKRRRRNNDPNAPKKNSSAMHLYIEAKKPAIKAANPEMPTMQINKQLAAEWGKLPVKERAVYSRKAAEAKAKYDEAMLDYEPPAEALLRSTKSGQRLQKDPKRPKKPKTAYLCFADRHRAALAKENPGAGVSLLSKKIAEKWKTVSDKEKAECEKQALADKERFDAAMKEYTPSEAYLTAKETFKQLKKAGQAGKGLMPPPPALLTVNQVSDGSLEEQNKALKALVEEQQAKIEAQAQQIDQLQKAAAAPPSAKESRKRSAPEQAPAPAPSKSSKAAAAADDETHYFEWTQKVLGVNGEKASPAMKKTLKEKGPEGLAEMLKKQYAAEHKKEPAAKRAKKS